VKVRKNGRGFEWKMLGNIIDFWGDTRLLIEDGYPVYRYLRILVNEPWY
jgi:hypothetical protein